MGSVSRPSALHGDGALSDADECVGAYYEDVARAEGLARLYLAPTALGHFYRHRMELITRLLGSARGDLLDAGCGTGQMLQHLQQALPGRFTLTGLDRSTANIAVACRILGDVPATSLVVARIEEMPFDDSSFDVVLAMGSLEYVVSVQEALAELARVTRPGGLAVVTMQHRSSPYRLWHEKVWSPLRRRRNGGESPIVHRLERRQLRAMLAGVGFEAETVESYGFNMLMPPLDELLPRLAIAVERSLDRVLPEPLRRVGSDYIVLARRSSGEKRQAAVAAEAG